MEDKEPEYKEIVSGSGSRVYSLELYEDDVVLCNGSMVDCLTGISFLGGREGRLGVILCFTWGIAFLSKNLAEEVTSIAELSLSMAGESKALLRGAGEGGSV